jgi:hypothetical protein
MAHRCIGIREFPAVIALALALTGSAQAQIYTSPLDNFTVPVPKGVGQRVQPQNDNDGGIVAFHDDFGGYRSIFYLRLSPSSIELQKDPEAHRANLEKFFNEYAMTWLFKPASPSASVLHSEHTRFGEESAYFAIVNLPESSTMFDVKAKKRHNTKRGMMVFERGRFIYMVGSGENPSVLELGNGEKPLEKLIEAERAKLASFASTISFK